MTPLGLMWQKITRLFARVQQDETCQTWDETRIKRLENRMDSNETKIAQETARVTKLDDLVTGIVVPGITTLRKGYEDLKAQPQAASVDTTQLDNAFDKLKSDLTNAMGLLNSTPATGITSATSATDSATSTDAAASTP